MNPSRVFTLADQIRYAKLSGDFNPIHVDPIYARRSPIGIVVHGVHLVLWSLDLFYQAHREAMAPGRVVATFLKPIALDEPVQWELTAESVAEASTWRINLQQNHTLMTTIRLELSPTARAWKSTTTQTNTGDGFPTPQRYAFTDLTGKSGVLDESTAGEFLFDEFPALASVAGTGFVANFNAYSTIVGMQTPGLNSLFCALDIRTTSGASADSLDNSVRYQVLRLLSPRAPFKISVESAKLKGELLVIYRPAPVQQMPMGELKALVSPREFVGRRTLVVGGSRGLGEVAAKLLAAGGAEVCVTYNHGKEEAVALQDEINTGDGRCDTQPFNVLEPSADLRDWLKQKRFNQILYFATPTIKANGSGVFNDSYYQGLRRFYVDGFAALVERLPLLPCSILYPSTVYVTEKPKEFAEYVKAKEDGETLARKISNDAQGLFSVEIVRLPRMATDQTNSFVPTKNEKPTDILLPILRRMSVDPPHVRGTHV